MSDSDGQTWYTSTYRYFGIFQVTDNHDYYTINTDDLDMDKLEDKGIHGNQSSHMTSSQSSLHDIVTRIPSDNCEIREISKEEILEIPDQYSSMAFGRRMSSTPSFHNTLYPCTAEDNCINASTPTLSRATSEQRISSSSDDVFTTCKSCSQLLFPDLDNGKPDMVQCQECGLFNIKLSPLDIHVSERTDSAICSTASDDSDHSNGSKSDLSTHSEEYLMPESPGISMATGLNKNDPSHKLVGKKNSFDFTEEVTFLNLYDNELVERNTSSEIPIQLSFISSDTKEYYYILRQHIESVLLKKQLSGDGDWAIANTKL